MDFWLFHTIWRYYGMYCSKVEDLEFPPAAYWTKWGEFIATFYSIVSFLAVSIAAIEKRDHRHKASLLEKFSGFLGQTSSTHALMITACYFIVKPEKEVINSESENWMILGMKYSSFYSHVLNSVISVVDIFLISCPRNLLHFWTSSLYLICYSLVNFMFWWNLGIVVYKPMDWGWWLEKNKIPEAVFLCLVMFFVVVPVFHGFLCILTEFRIFLWKRCCCRKKFKKGQLLENEV